MSPRLAARIVAANVAAIVAPLLAAPGCGTRDRERPEEVRREPERQRRVIEPPVGIVRALPPHAIRADGVGPYRLGEKLSSLLDQLPSGPRIALFEIPGLLHRNLIRAEDDTVLIGGEPGGVATFVAVVGSEVARTESGVHVGSPRLEVERVLGAPLVEPARLADPRIYVPASLPGARVLLDADRVAAIVVTGQGSPLARPQPAPPPIVDGGVADAGCARPAGKDGALGACLTAAGELITIGEGEITVRGAEERAPRVLTPIKPAFPIVFAGPVRTDGRDELVVVTRADGPEDRTWWLQSFRVVGGRLVPALEPARLYGISATNAAWIGAALDGLDLFLEVTAHPDGFEVGGLLTSRSGAQGPPWRDVVVISPVSVARRPGPRAAPVEPPDGGPPGADAGVPVDAPRAVEGSTGHGHDSAPHDAAAAPPAP